MFPRPHPLVHNECRNIRRRTGPTQGRAGPTRHHRDGGRAEAVGAASTHTAGRVSAQSRLRQSRPRRVFPQPTGRRGRRRKDRWTRPALPPGACGRGGTHYLSTSRNRTLNHRRAWATLCWTRPQSRKVLALTVRSPRPGEGRGPIGLNTPIADPKSAAPPKAKRRKAHPCAKLRNSVSNAQRSR